MEVIYTSLLGFFLLLVIYLFFYNQKPSGNANLPPGKTGLPLIGETLEFLHAGWNGHPEKFISDRVAKYSSTVFKTNLFGSPFVVFSGVNELRFLFSNENKLVRVWIPPSVSKIFSPSTKPVSDALAVAISMRQDILDFTKPVPLQSQITEMDNFVNCHFVTNWENTDMVRVFPLAKHYAFHFSCRFLTGIEDPNLLAIIRDHFGCLVKGIYSVPLDLPGTPFNRAIKASSFIQKELLVIIEQRKIDLAKGMTSPTQDILSHMLSTSDDNENEADVAYKICGLLLAAHDNVASVCTFIVKYLAELPEVYQQVYEEQLRIAKSKGHDEFLNLDDMQKMKYSWNVAREVMRIGTASPGTFREALTDFTYNGFTIPKGCKIYWHPRSTQTNPEFFPEPQKFDPSRFESSGPPPYAYVPFGGGPRGCPGKEFARLTILLFMHHVVKRFRLEKLIPNERTVHTPSANPEKGLPVRLIPHEV